MIMKKHFLLVLTLILAGFHAEAAVTFVPAPPTEQDVIAAIIDVSTAIIYDFPSTTVTGHAIRTNLTVIGFVGGPPPVSTHIFAPFGPLPQGTYTYQVYEIYQGHATLLAQQTLVIAPPIPVMNTWKLAILAMFLAVIACFTLGKHA